MGDRQVPDAGRCGLTMQPLMRRLPSSWRSHGWATCCGRITMACLVPTYGVTIGQAARTKVWGVVMQDLQPFISSFLRAQCH
jgi:hypothetical protein